MSVRTEQPPAQTTTPTWARGTATSRTVVMVVLLLNLVYCVFPILWLLIASTKSTGDLSATGGFALTGHALPQLGKNLSALSSYGGGIFWRWLANTCLYAVGGAAVATVLSTLAGYALAKYEFRGKAVFSAVVLGGVMLPATVLAVPLYLLASKVGMEGTVWSVLLPGCVSPVGVYMVRVFAGSAVPVELLEAARLDGASEGRIFASVVVRLLAPAMTTVFVFQFVAVWNNYFLPLIMLSHENRFPVTLGLVTWQSNIVHDPSLTPLVVTGAAVSTVPLIIAFLALQRFWRADIAAGGVKG